MNSYYMPHTMYRNPQDTRFFPFLPFVAGLATGGLLTIPFLAGRPYYPPPYPIYPPYPVYPQAYPPYGMYGGIPGAGVPYPAVNVASQQYFVQ